MKKIYTIKYKSSLLVGSLALFFFTACSSIEYLWHVSVEQVDLLNDRVPIEEAFEEYDFSADEKKKLEMVSEIKTFALEKLKMNIDKDIYSTYVQLYRPYVSYLLRVSPAYELKAYTWDFPIVGSMPYKGYFDKEMAKEAAESFPKEEYDIYIRGVTAYSTLGWFEDPIYSSMLSYSESDFAVTIFHELAHTVLFFKDHVNFNERFAEFIGRKAAIAFYLKKEGGSKIVTTMQKEWEDELLFSSFMVREYNALSNWYKINIGKISREMKQKRLAEIQKRFLVEVQPKLQTTNYNHFAKIKLNNARLLAYRSYNYSMDEFEKLFFSPIVNKDIKLFIDYCAQFEKEEDPEKAVSLAIQNLNY